ncbi:HrgC protein [Vagococcus zengguangii]|uniref:HrgC protein n=1 Tax=Vagococcus zengguangii TaxID=2571750 RepID=A0A4D7CQS8_9ENTE|nr:HrgC protein [Vagococcus zengguangii]
MIKLVNNDTHSVIYAKHGISWTCLFFGCLVPFIRADYKWMLVMFIANSFTHGFAIIIFAMIYNRIYVDSLLNQGYEIVTDEY